MSDTSCEKIEFGSKATIQPEKDIIQSTRLLKNESSILVKVIQKNSDEKSITVYKKVNYTDQKKREIYRQINKMLGGY